jgi:recombination associated protein RdgC
MFRNLRFYRLQNDWPESEAALSSELEKAGFKPCGPLTERSSGWMPVDPDTSELLARRVNGADLLRLRSQSRILPPAAINEVLDLRIEEYRERMQEAPSSREKRRLKAETRDELLPKSMLKSDRTWGYVDLQEKLIGIDAAQEAVAERFMRRLQAPFDGLHSKPLQFQQPVDGFLTSIFLGDAHDRFTVGRECRMQDMSELRSYVRWTDFDLGDESIREHVVNGMRLTHLAIEYDHVMSFVLDENGVITKLRFLGVDDDGSDNTPLAKLDAEFVLLTGTLRRLLSDLKKSLGGFA